MLTDLDVVLVFLVGSLLTNPSRSRTLGRALLRAFLCGAVVTVVYLLAAKPLLIWMGVFR